MRLNPLLTSKKIGSLLSSGVPRLTESKGKRFTVSSRIFTLHGCAIPLARCFTAFARECVGLKCDVPTGDVENVPSLACG